MFKILFLSSIFSIFYAYLGYIALVCIASLIFRIKLEKKEVCPPVSIIVACYNEERCIKQKIENILSLEYPSDKLQIIIASESTDRTNEIVSQYFNRDVLLIESKKRCGKTGLLFQSVPKATGEILIFSDANVLLKNDSLKKIIRNFSDKKVGAVVGRVVINNPSASSMSFGENIYKKYETILRIASSRLGRVLNPDGALFAIRKELYNPLSLERGDDFELVIRTLISGRWSVFEPEAICYENASISAEAEIGRKIRMVSWFIGSTIILTKEMFLKGRLDLVFQIVSHKILRWLTPYFLILIFISSIFLLNNGLGIKLFFIVQVLGYFLGIVSLYFSEKHKLPQPLVLKMLGYFVMFNYAFALGISRGMFGKKISASWEIKRS